MLKRRIWFGLIGAALASGVAAQQYATIIDNLPTCIGNRNGRVISVSDAVDEADCTVGGAVGDARVVHQCICDTLNVLGPYWKSTAGSGGGLADGDKGDITVASSGAAWTVDANAVALGTDTTGNYAGSASEGGEANTLAPAVVIEGATADGFEGNFAFTDPTADWTWTWGATGAVSGVASITGGASGSSTLTLDGDSTVTGSASVDGAGNLSANKATVATGTTGGVVIGGILLRELLNTLVLTDPAITVYRDIYARSIALAGDISLPGTATALIVVMTPGAVGSCGAGQKGYLRVAADGTLCSCNGTVWTATPGSGSCT